MRHILDNTYETGGEQGDSWQGTLSRIIILVFTSEINLNISGACIKLDSWEKSLYGVFFIFDIQVCCMYYTHYLVKNDYLGLEFWN